MAHLTNVQAQFFYLHLFISLLLLLYTYFRVLKSNPINDKSQVNTLTSLYMRTIQK